MAMDRSCWTWGALSIGVVFALSGCDHQCDKPPEVCPKPFDVTAFCGSSGQCTTNDGPAACDSTCKLDRGEVLRVPMDQLGGQIGTRQALALWYLGNHGSTGYPDEINADVTLAGVIGAPIELDRDNSAVHFVWEDFSPTGDLTVSYSDGSLTADRIQLYFADLPCAVVNEPEPCEE